MPWPEQFMVTRCKANRLPRHATRREPVVGVLDGELAAWIGPVLVMRYARDHKVWRGYFLVPAQADFFGATDRTVIAQAPVGDVSTIYSLFGRWLEWLASSGSSYWLFGC